MRSPAVLLFVAIGTLACLSPVQNDTWWHLRSGQEMFRTHTLLFEDRFSYTASGQFFWNHSWLSQLAFYALYRVGGLPLLTGVCASAILGAWMVTWSSMRGPLTDRLMLAGLALSSATLTWSVRPQAFSLLLVPVVVWLASEDRWRALLPLFALWANLHAGFVLGLVLVASTVATALIWDRSRFLRRAGWAALCAAVTLATPLGIRNWTEVLASTARSRANAIQEWQPTSFSVEHVAFWGLAALLVVVAVTRWKRLEGPADRVLVMAAVVVLPLAVQSMRNVPAFAMLVAPAASRLMFRRSPSESMRLNPLLAGAAILVGISVVVIAWKGPWARLGWHPMSPGAARAVAACPPPLFNTYEGGGPIIWFAPTQPVFVDSRQDPFPVTLVQAAGKVERTGDYAQVFTMWHIHCAVLPPASPAVKRLRGDGWDARFSDEQWVVLDHTSK